MQRGTRGIGGGDGHDGDLSFSGCGIVGGVLGEEAEYLDVGFRTDSAGVMHPLQVAKIEHTADTRSWVAYLHTRQSFGLT